MKKWDKERGRDGIDAANKEKQRETVGYWSMNRRAEADRVNCPGCDQIWTRQLCNGSMLK